MKTYPDEPIFPEKEYYNVPCLGLTKREYFIGMALQGLISGVRASGDSINIKELTLSAILITDHLITELNK